MGLLSFFSKPGPRTGPVALPNGSFTVDAAGQVLSSTLPSGFPESLAKQIGQAVLQTFQSAYHAQIQLSELTVTYVGFKITARETRGGAIIFLAARRRPGP